MKSPPMTRPVATETRTANSTPFALPTLASSLGHGIDDRKTGTYRAFGIILMGLVQTEGCENAITKETVDTAAKAFNARRARVAVGVVHLATIFGIQLASTSPWTQRDQQT